MSLKQTMEYIEKNKDTYLERMKASEALKRNGLNGHTNIQNQRKQTTLQAAKLK